LLPMPPWRETRPVFPARLVKVSLIPASAEKLLPHIKGLWTAFPDYHIELLNAGEIELGLVARQGFEIKQKLNPPGPSALIQTPGLPVSQP
jgi:hypothetical protein